MRLWGLKFRVQRSLGQNKRTKLLGRKEQLIKQKRSIKEAPKEKKKTRRESGRCLPIESQKAFLNQTGALCWGLSYLLLLPGFTYFVIL